VKVADPERPGHPEPPAANGKPPSAVLVPIYDTPEGPEVLFTRRAWHLRSHAGQVSFPGGRRDREDVDLVDTALRETEEEIGLARRDVEIVGELERLTTITSPANIVPILGVLPGRPENLTISPQEVDDVLLVPVRELLRPDVYREEIWFRQMAPNASFEGIPITFFELVGDTLWGATARIVRTWFEQL
jgi:8-oxo-dGTP pyrophosphatase MutT (NUDIX family)